MPGFAWVTLATNDSYSLGALVVAQSLKRVNTAHQLVVLITPGVSQTMRDKLNAVFDLVREVNVLDSQDAANLALLSRPELGITFTKLHAWRLTEYEKCVFLDADTLVLQNCDELFEREELSAAPDVGWPDCFNSGVFVFKPDLGTFDKLVKFAADKGSFDGGDQGLLNLVFSDWSLGDSSRRLPFVYNMSSTACYSYLPAFKQFGQDAKIIHFIGNNKPWLQYFDSASRQVHPPQGEGHLTGLLQLWWDIFCDRVHPELSPNMAGLAGAFAQITLGVARSEAQTAFEETMRKQAWEAGHIDYLGRDSFDNIWAKISQTLEEKPEAESAKSAEDSPKEEIKIESVLETESVVQSTVETESSKVGGDASIASTEGSVPASETVESKEGETPQEEKKQETFITEFVLKPTPPATPVESPKTIEELLQPSVPESVSIEAASTESQAAPAEPLTATTPTTIPESVSSDAVSTESSSAPAESITETIPTPVAEVLVKEDIKTVVEAAPASESIPDVEKQPATPAEAVVPPTESALVTEAVAPVHEVTAEVAASAETTESKAVETALPAETTAPIAPTEAVPAVVSVEAALPVETAAPVAAAEAAPAVVSVAAVPTEAAVPLVSAEAVVAVNTEVSPAPEKAAGEAVVLPETTIPVELVASTKIEETSSEPTVPVTAAETAAPVEPAVSAESVLPVSVAPSEAVISTESAVPVDQPLPVASVEAAAPVEPTISKEVVTPVEAATPTAPAVETTAVVVEKPAENLSASISEESKTAVESKSTLPEAPVSQDKKEDQSPQVLPADIPKTEDVAPTIPVEAATVEQASVIQPEQKIEAEPAKTDTVTGPATVSETPLVTEKIESAVVAPVESVKTEEKKDIPQEKSDKVESPAEVKAESLPSSVPVEAPKSGDQVPKVEEKKESTVSPSVESIKPESEQKTEEPAVASAPVEKSETKPTKVELPPPSSETSCPLVPKTPTIIEATPPTSPPVCPLSDIPSVAELKVETQTPDTPPAGDKKEPVIKVARKVTKVKKEKKEAATETLVKVLDEPVLKVDPQSKSAPTSEPSTPSTEESKGTSSTSKTDAPVPPPRKKEPKKVTKTAKPTPK